MDGFLKKFQQAATVIPMYGEHPTNSTQPPIILQLFTFFSLFPPLFHKDHFHLHFSVYLSNNVYIEPGKYFN